MTTATWDCLKVKDHEAHEELTNREKNKVTTMMKSNSKNRSGITLLFVISMIVLFLLMGASFVLMSTQFRRSTDNRARIQTRRDDARTLVSRAFYDLFRGPTLDNRFSPLRGHSILADQYGYGKTSVVSNAVTMGNTDGQFLSVELDSDAGTPGDQYFQIIDQTVLTFSDQEGEYDGLILTFTDGPAVGISTRIVAYLVNLDPATGNVLSRQFMFMPPWNDQQDAFATPADLVGSNVVINERPFSGSGAGQYDGTAAIDVAALSTHANTPNRVNNSVNQLLSQYLAFSDGTPNPLSTCENYDALDEQNMFLAAIGDIDATGAVDVIPSFYRSDLAGNGGFSAFGGIDVDNDGDGTNDSIWIDIGLPLQTDMRGRVYRPLVSYLVIDMDGKLNVNAAGNLMDVDGNYINTYPDMLGGVNGSVDQTLGGQGWGPPEINMSTVFTINDYTYLLRGDTLGNVMGTPIPGRYGADEVPGGGTADLALQAKMQNYPQRSFAARGLVGGLFGSPMDVHGRISYGYADYTQTLLTDPYDSASATADVPWGMPVPNIRTSGLLNEYFNNPYEMSFRNDTFIPDEALDTPYSAREMERVLRLYDHDSVMLPPRLRAFTRETLDGNPDARWDFTTDSRELPVTPTHLVNRLREVLVAEAGIATNADGTVVDPLDNLFLKAQVNFMLSPEIKRGQRMNVNRLFGNGVDDNGDDVVDDPTEALSTQTVLGTSGNPATMGLSNLSHQQFARHLYILALLLTEQGLSDVSAYDYDMDGDVDPDDIQQYRIDIAQWAINVANFRDPDSIMQPFEVDLEPWDGWHVNGILDDDTLTTGAGHEYNGQTTEIPGSRIVLWGAERPELLMTESAAFHDRRTQDRSDDPSGNDVAGGDFHLDSLLVPKASVFFEFYNPWVHSGNAGVDSNSQVKPAEFYGTQNGVILQKTSTDGSSPVWRVLVTNRDGHDLNPDNGELDPANIIRRVYFTQPDVSVVNDHSTPEEVYFSDIALASGGLVLPGQHAVIGSSGVGTEGVNGDNHHTFLGRRSTGSWVADLANDSRRISMNHSARTLELCYFDTGAGNWDTITRTDVVTLPINLQENGAAGKARSLGITDPILGYDSPANPGVILGAVEDGFQFLDAVAPNGPMPLDEPVDQTLSMAEWGTPAQPGLKDDGLHRISTATADDLIGRVAHLQRLANPLEPFDAVLNPYLTVDSLGVPVNVYNGVSGEDEVDATGAGGTFAQLTGFFKSYERGETEDDSSRYRWLWKAPQHGHLSPDPTTATPGDLSFVSFNLDNSLGELDQVYRVPSPSAPSLGNEAFPWLTWNNRPFSSHLELANVPFTSSYRLLSFFDTREAARNNYNPPDEGVPVNATNEGIPNCAGDYGHLLGFHAHSDDSPRLQVILDYLEVPSRFVGTEKFLNEDIFDARGTSPGTAYGFTPPYHDISNFRYPGKVNINTVFSDRAWNAVMGNYASEVSYADLNASRRGGSTGTASFDAPFRATETINLVPTGSVVNGTADAGLFRRDAMGAASGVAPEDGLFDMNSTAALPRIDPARSAYFRNDMRQRLGNVATTRSSVFSIWITVGFFEVDENLNPVAEVGADTGDIQRYRGFYMVDRSIPVGFQPGFNHNVDQAILTSSITERATTRD